MEEATGADENDDCAKKVKERFDHYAAQKLKKETFAENIHGKRTSPRKMLLQRKLSLRMYQKVVRNLRSRRSPYRSKLMRRVKIRNQRVYPLPLPPSMGWSWH